MEKIKIVNLLERIISDCEKARGMILSSDRDKPPEGFEKFWALYPKPENEIQARREWDLSIQEEDVHKILTVLSKAVWPDQKRFIPSPHRWLRDKRWKDQKQEENNGKYRGLGETV